jgi:hypothetical protein
MSFVLSLVLTILVLFTVYGLVLWGLTLALRRLGVPSKGSIIIAFLIFAVGTGVWVALVWPLDSSTLLNFPASLFGDALYQWSIRYLGDPSSPQAHYTIPWLLRVPQVYVVASIILWGFLGLMIQLIHNHRRQIALCFRCYRSGAAA